MIKKTIEEKINSLNKTNSEQMVADLQPFEKDNFVFHKFSKKFYHNMAMIDLIMQDKNKDIFDMTSITILFIDSAKGDISYIIEEPDPMGFSDDHEIAKTVNQSKIEKMKWITKKTPLSLKS
jgi:hypothetical protein